MNKGSSGRVLNLELYDPADELQFHNLQMLFRYYSGRWVTL
jgi:hypothetical protein